MELLNFIIIYSILIISILGYGLIFSKKITKYNNFLFSKVSIGIIGIYGIFALVFISFLTNLFLPHNNIHNMVVICIGLISFIFLYSKNKKIIKINFFLLAYLLSFFLILHFKSHDDFSYYHLSFIKNINLNKIEFGLGHFDVAFNHVSSLFYFHSLFATKFTNDFYYFLAQASIVVFINTILFEKIYKNSKLNISFFLSVFCLIFINIFFYRIAEHGTDRSAQILFFLAFIFVVDILENKKFSNQIFETLIIILTLIVTIKSFYIMYSLILFLLYFKYYKLKEFFYFINKFSVVYLCLLSIIFLIIYNVSHSGCFLYPVSSTCMSEFFWGYSKERVSDYMEWYELWSKAGATPNMIVPNNKEYLSGFNWINNWVQYYFFNKFSDFFLGVILTVIICCSIFKIKNFSLKGFNIFRSFYFILILLLLEWFINHPALRYGGYVLVFLIVVFPFCLILKNQNYKFNQKKKSLKIILLLTLFIFIYRSVDRINYEKNAYEYNLVKSPYYKINNNFYTMQNHKKNFFKDINKCNFSNSLRNIKCKKIYSYNFYYIDK